MAQLDGELPALVLPDPPGSAPDGIAGELEKARYQAELDAARAVHQAAIDRQKALQAAYIDVTRASLDRTMTRAQAITTAASVVGTVYTGVIGVSYKLGSGNSGNPLPARGVIPALFLGLSVFLTATFMAYVRRSRPIARSIRNEDDLVDWAASVYRHRHYFLRAAVFSLGIGVMFLPVAFLNEASAPSDRTFVWLTVIGLLVVLCGPFLLWSLLEWFDKHPGRQ